MNLLTAKTKTKKLIDEYSTRGTINTDHNINMTDYALKMNDYFDIAQKEISTVKHIPRVEKIAHILPSNLLKTGFCEHPQEGGSISFQTKGKAYYFEVAGDVDAVITCGNETETIENFSKGFTKYKGCFESEGILTISFNSGYMYTVRNIAIFAVANPSDYSADIRYKLPDNVFKVNNVTLNGRDKFEHFFKADSLFVNYRERGEIIMEYSAMPCTIDENTSDYYDFEIAEDVQDAMCFYVAALLLQSENPSMYSILYSQYQNKLSNADRARLPLPNRIKRVVR